MLPSFLFQSPNLPFQVCGSCKSRRKTKVSPLFKDLICKPFFLEPSLTVPVLEGIHHSSWRHCNVAHSFLPIPKSEYFPRRQFNILTEDSHHNSHLDQPMNSLTSSILKASYFFLLHFGHPWQWLTQFCHHQEKLIPNCTFPLSNQTPILAVLSLLCVLYLFLDLT